MNPRLGRSPKIDPHKLIGEKRQIQAAIVTTLVVAVLNGLSSQGFSTPPSPFSGVQSGWAIPLVRGGELVELEWNAAAPSGDGPSLIHHSHLRSKEDAAKLDERIATRIAGYGFSGLSIGCIAWYDALETIEAKRGPWLEALTRARRKGLRDNFISYHMFYKNGEWNAHNPTVPSQPSDWFDHEVWEHIYSNMRATARFAREAKAHGIALDIESYGFTPLSPAQWKDRADEARRMAQRRGSELAEAMLAEFPEMKLMVLPAYYIWGGLPKLIGDRSYAEPFVLAIAETFAQRQSPDGPGGFLPASEFTYGPVGDMTVDSCLGRIDWVIENLERPLASFAKRYPEYYRARVQLAPGIWPLGDYQKDEGGGTDDRRYAPEEHRNMLEAYRQRGARVIWAYGQNWAWYTSAWDAYAEVNHRFRESARYHVYRGGGAQKSELVTTTHKLSARFSAHAVGDEYLVRTTRPEGEKEGQSERFKPRRVDGVADDFATGVGDHWTIASDPPRRGPNRQFGSTSLEFIIRKSNDPTQISMSFKGAPRTSGSAWLTIRSLRRRGGNDLSGIGLRLYADENHWAHLTRTATGFRLRWKSGEKEGKAGAGFDNNGAGGEFGVEWNTDAGTVTWHVEGIPGKTGTVEVDLPPCQVQIYAWAEPNAELRTTVDDFILTRRGSR